MTRIAILFAGSAFVAALPAAAGTIVLGSNSARLCYEAAESPMTPTAEDMDECNAAFVRDNLNRRDTVATYVNRGILKLRTNQHGEAIADFDRALSLDPNQPEAYLNKAVTLLRLPDGPRQALPLFSTAIEKRTQRPAIAYFGRGVAHELSGNIRAAYHDYRMASRLDPKWSEPRTELARFKVRQP